MRSGDSWGAMAAIGVGALTSAVFGCHAPTIAGSEPRSTPSRLDFETPPVGSPVELFVHRIGRATYLPARDDAASDLRFALIVEEGPQGWLVFVPARVCPVGSPSCSALRLEDFDDDVSPGPLRTGAGVLRHLDPPERLEFEPFDVAGQLFFVPTSDGAPQVLRGTLEAAPATGSGLRLGLAQTTALCANGWVESGEACDPGTAESPGCDRCRLQPPSCEQGEVVRWRCTGEPSTCEMLPCNAGACVTPPSLAVSATLEGRTFASATETVRLWIDGAAAACACATDTRGTTCAGTCRVERHACSTLGVSLELPPGERVRAWTGCIEDDGRCTVELPASGDVLISAHVDAGVHSGIRRIDVLPEAERSHLAAGSPARIVTAHTLSSHAVTLPEAGGSLFRIAQGIVGWIGVGQRVWERRLGGKGGHVRAQSVALADGGAAVMLGRFPDRTVVVPEDSLGDTRRVRRTARPVIVPPEELRAVGFDSFGTAVWQARLGPPGPAVADIGEDGVTRVVVDAPGPSVRWFAVSPEGDVSKRGIQEAKSADLQFLAITSTPSGALVVTSLEDSVDSTPRYAFVRWDWESEGFAVVPIAEGVDRLEGAAAFAPADGELRFVQSANGKLRVQRFTLAADSVWSTDVPVEGRCGSPRIATEQGDSVVVTALCSPDVSQANGWAAVRIDPQGNLVWQERYGHVADRFNLDGLGVSSETVVLVGTFERGHLEGAHPLRGDRGAFRIWLDP